MKKITKRIMALMLSLVMMLGCISSLINEASAATEHTIIIKNLVPGNAASAVEVWDGDTKLKGYLQVQKSGLLYMGTLEANETYILQYTTGGMDNIPSGDTCTFVADSSSNFEFTGDITSQTAVMGKNQYAPGSMFNFKIEINTLGPKTTPIMTAASGGEETGLTLTGTKAAVYGTDYDVVLDDENTINIATSGWKLEGKLNSGIFENGEVDILVDSDDDMCLTIGDLDENDQIIRLQLRSETDIKVIIDITKPIKITQLEFYQAAGAPKAHLLLNSDNEFNVDKLHFSITNDAEIIGPGIINTSIEFYNTSSKLTIDNATINAKTKERSDIGIPIYSMADIDVTNQSKLISINDLEGEGSYGLCMMGSLNVDDTSECFSSGNMMAICGIMQPAITDITPWKCSGEVVPYNSKNSLTESMDVIEDDMQYFSVIKDSDPLIPAKTAYKKVKPIDTKPHVTLVDFKDDSDFTDYSAKFSITTKDGVLHEKDLDCMIYKVIDGKTKTIPESNFDNENDYLLANIFKYDDCTEPFANGDIEELAGTEVILDLNPSKEKNDAWKNIICKVKFTDTDIAVYISAYDQLKRTYGYNGSLDDTVIETINVSETITDDIIDVVYPLNNELIHGSFNGLLIENGIDGYYLLDNSGLYIYDHDSYKKGEKIDEAKMHMSYIVYPLYGSCIEVQYDEDTKSINTNLYKGWYTNNITPSDKVENSLIYTWYKAEDNADGVNLFEGTNDTVDTGYGSLPCKKSIISETTAYFIPMGSAINDLKITPINSDSGYHEMVGAIFESTSIEPMDLEITFGTKIPGDISDYLTHKRPDIIDEDNKKVIFKEFTNIPMGMIEMVDEDPYTIESMVLKPRFKNLVEIPGQTSKTYTGSESGTFAAKVALNLEGTNAAAIPNPIGFTNLIEIEAPTPTSSGSSKKYKATDTKDTAEKITGTGKKGSTRTIVPEEGRKVASVKVVDKNGNEIPVTMNEDGTYSFEQPASNVDVLVSYQNREITLNIGSTEASVDGERENLDVCPVIRNDRTMLPIRFVAENLGAKVDWDEKDPNYVVITRGDTKIEITLGSDIMKVNGKDVKLDSVAFAENDRTYLPVRAISEALNAIVEWNEERQEVKIIEQ